MSGRLRSGRPAAPSGLETLAERCAALDRVSMSCADERVQALFSRASEIRDRLIASAEHDVLLHGDLHHENLLRTEREGEELWVAIDPQGLTGDPAYDVANVFGNPLGHPDIALDPGRPARLADRFASGLSLDRKRLLGWGFVHSCVSAAWALEDGDDPSWRLEVARLVLAGHSGSMSSL